MDIKFFDDPLEEPKPREDVRILQIGLYLYPDLRRLAFGVELTPFRERPSIEVTITNGQGAPAGSLHVIETVTPNFSLTMHLRDDAITNPYTLTAVLYYSWPDRDKIEIERRQVSFEVTQPGELIFKFDQQPGDN
ncbi:MAG: hypothetical protein KIS95_02310 [Anaerolineae bacterium]|uniref:hypothetical protein n=1 Tax=Promineifilum sp. TaxID=2664178 RepID=UPI001D4BF83E|nr:hypothetical protein [Anaerolineales bacterium]MCO5182154.1 hypothetical protein [Promineifilum sp.]MCW5846037.1 hypothetical protein [Anaerolineae bacterium]